MPFIKKLVVQNPFSDQRTLKSLFVILFILSYFFLFTPFFLSLFPPRLDFSDPISSLDLSKSSASTSGILTIHAKVSQLHSNFSRADSFSDSHIKQIDSSGDIYIAGNAFFISEPDSLVGDDIFVAKFNSSGSLIFNISLGGSLFEFISDFAIDDAGNSYVLGETNSFDFPTKNAYQDRFGTSPNCSERFCGDIFIAKFNSTGGLIFSSYFGDYYDFGLNIAVDSAGNSYITGYTQSSDFPTKNAFDTTYNGGLDAFLAKFNSSGSLVFSTYLGGSNLDYGSGMAVDSSGNSYLTGSTYSNDFPTKNAFQTNSSGGSDVFLCKFNASGEQIFSTYLGGSSDDVNLHMYSNIAIDSRGNSYVLGETFSTDFPTRNAYQSFHVGDIGNPNIFLSNFNASGALIFSTYFGEAEPSAFAVDSVGNCYITGATSSSDFPIRNAFQSSIAGNGTSDIFLSKFNFLGGLVFSTFLGGNNSDAVSDLKIDSDNNSYVIGITNSDNFPTRNAFNSSYSGCGFCDSDDLVGDVFLAKFNSTGSLAFSTYLGGSGIEYGPRLTVDNAGNSYATGITLSNDFPTKNAYQSTLIGYQDIFLSKFTFTGGLTFSTYFGNIYLITHPPVISNPYPTTITNYSSSVSSSTKLANKFSFTFGNYFTLLFLGVLVLVSVASVFVVVEYRKYSLTKRNTIRKSGSSFKSYLKNFFTNHFKKENVPNHISDKIFELLEEIEKENISDK